MKAQVICPECGQGLANRRNLRRHTNSQHSQAELYICECGKRYYDPTGLSRCKGSHKRFFRCPVPGCLHECKRKDSVKQHLQRKHPKSRGLEVLTISRPSSSSSQSSTAGDLTPPLPVDVTPSIPLLQLDHSFPSPIHEYPLNWTGDLTPPSQLPIDAIPPLQLDPSIPCPIQFSLESQMPILPQYRSADQFVTPQHWSTGHSVTPQHWWSDQSAVPQSWSTDQSVTALTALWGDHLHL